MTLSPTSPTSPHRKKPPLRRGSGSGRGGWYTIRREALRVLWSKIVRARDQNTCQKCGKTEAHGQIDAAHILGAGSHPNLKYLIMNGIALCASHHRWFDQNKNRARDGDADRWAREKIGEERYAELLIMAKVYRRPGKDEIKIGLKELAKQYGVSVLRPRE